MANRRSLVFLAANLLGLNSCSPADEAGAPSALPETKWLSGHDPAEILDAEFCSTPQPGETPLRRLSNLEYRNTLVDLGFDAHLVDQAVAVLPSEPESLGFRNAASALSVTSLLAEKYRTIAKGLTAHYAYPCPSDDEVSCAVDMIERAGERIYRRPLGAEERTAYMGLYETARQKSAHQEALAWVARGMLQSPHFLYRVELPDPQEVVRANGYELASRLSYALWHASPDEELRRAARTGELENEEQVRAQVLRMLQDQRSRAVLEFFRQWLDLDDLHEVKRQGPAYEGISSQLAELMKAEAEGFLSNLLRTPGSSFQDLLSAEYTFANAQLAQHYDLEPVEGDAFVKVEAPGRRGVLTQGMLAANDGPTRTSIVRRGLKIRTDFLCQTVPTPPDSVDLTLDGIGDDVTQSERLRLHSTDASCKGCHSLMDPIGRAFEGFDAVGRARVVDEYQNPVDARGEFTRTLDADGPVEGVEGLAARLSESMEAQQCYMIQNLRFYLGREVDAADLCSQAQVFSRWKASSLSLVDLIVAIVESDAFLYKAKLETAPAAASEESGDEP